MVTTYKGDDTTGLEEFSRVYRAELRKAVEEYPEEYQWPLEKAPSVASTMLRAIVSQSYNKDSRAIKATCKLLGIKYTYKAIQAYIS